MGYTQYFTNIESSDENWKEFVEVVKSIISDSKVPLDLYIVDNSIYIDGVGDDGHEDLYISKDRNDAFNFCNTARKPYDSAVCAILHMYEHICGEKVHVKSDGDLSDEGWAFAYNYILKKFGVEYLTGCYYRRRSEARKELQNKEYTLENPDNSYLEVWEDKSEEPTRGPEEMDVEVQELRELVKLLTKHGKFEMFNEDTSHRRMDELYWKHFSK